MTSMLDSSAVENSKTCGGAGPYNWGALTKHNADRVATAISSETENGWPSSWGEWLQLDEESRCALVSFCFDAFRFNYRKPMKRVNESSYGLKHLFEGAESGFYVTNGQFKMAMLFADIPPDDPRKMNWTWKRLWFSTYWDTKSYPWKWNGV